MILTHLIYETCIPTNDIPLTWFSEEDQTSFEIDLNNNENKSLTKVMQINQRKTSNEQLSQRVGAVPDPIGLGGNDGLLYP